MVDAIKNRLSFARKKFDNFQSDALETMEVAVFAACIVLGVLLVTPPLEAALGTFFTNTVASVQTPAAPTPGTGEILVPGAEGDVDKGVTQVEYQKLLSKVDEVNQEAAATKAALATTNNELAAQKEAWASIARDTGWIALCPIADYRVIGGTVTIRLVNEGAITIGHDVYSLGVLPVQYRPTKAISTVASGTGDGATFGLTVAKDGHVYTRSETTLSNNWARGMLTYPLG